MERMLVVVFDGEKAVYEGSRALRQLDVEGNITVYGAAVVAKAADGSTQVRDADGVGPSGVLAGTALGSLVGLLGGPVGVLVGATGGAMIGALPDLEDARIGADFLDETVAALAPGKTALVAEIDEEWTAPVDTRMEALGGQVLRRSLADVTDEIHKRDVAAMKADLAQLKAEQATARAERKAQLQARIDTLSARLQKKVDAAKARREAIHREATARVERLKERATSANEDWKDRSEKALSDLKRQYRDFL